MATLLENTNREKRRQIRDYLRKHPGTLEKFQRSFRRAGRECGVGEKHLQVFDGHYKRLSRYVSRRSDWKLVDQEIAAVDKVASVYGITPSERRRLARQWEPTGPRGQHTLVCELRTSGSGGGHAAVMRAGRVLRVGRWVAGLGAVLWVFGWLLGIAAFSGGGSAGLALGLGVAGTLGAFMVIVGLVVVIVGGVMKSTARRKARRRGEALPQRKGLNELGMYNTRLRKALNWIDAQRRNSDRPMRGLVQEAAWRFHVLQSDIRHHLR
jgi:hypothetical protein